MKLIESYLLENKIARRIDTIYWVGGFGGCKYLRNQLEMLIEKEFQGCVYHFPVPPEPDLAVILGATALGCNPNIFAKRKSDVTCGGALSHEWAFIHLVSKPKNLEKEDIVIQQVF